MYAIRHKRTKEFVFGTDRKRFPYRQRTSKESGLIFYSYALAKIEFFSRMCNDRYEIVPVRIIAEEA